MAEPSAGVLLVWQVACVEAQAATHATIKAGHFFVALCKVCDLPLDEILGPEAQQAPEACQAQAEVAELRQVFEEAGVDVVRCRRRLRALLGVEALVAADGIMHRDLASRRIFASAERLAADAGQAEFRPVHLLLSLLETEGEWQQVLREMGIRSESLEAAARRVAERGGPAEGEVLGPGSQTAEEKRSATPLLGALGRDLTDLARKGRLDRVVGREEEIRSLARVLLQQGRNCAVLVGEAGMGKSCIVEGLAQRLASEEVAEDFRGKRLAQVSTGSLVAGTMYRGQFEERLQQLLREAASPDILLFIDEIHTLLGAGAGGSALDAANLLKPALARGEIRCIGATTPAEYSQFMERDEALMRRFQVLWVEEPSRQEAMEILQGVKGVLERHHRLSISDEALAAVEFSVRFLPTLRLPDKARQLLDEACAGARLRTMRHTEQVSTLTRDHVAEVVARRCRVPLDALRESDQARLLRLEERLGERVFGQREALQQIGEALRAAEVGLGLPRRPRAVFLFMGPTGVGKTETCRALAEFLFGSDDRLLQFNMSEFSEPHSVAKLIGAPPGYVGHEQGGQLVEAMRRNPYAVVLFDEFDRAHPEVRKLFLQMFEEGRLTDARGRQARFHESIIALTTNLGAGADQARRMGFRKEEEVEQERDIRRERMRAALQAVLPPELINRLDRILFFEPLGCDAMRAIIEKALRPLCERLSARNITLRLDEAAYQFIEERGFEQEFGARAINRAVQKFIADPIARMILEGRAADSGELFVYVDEGAIQISERGLE
jgi:ATP-dependent Clp protease ATP-binding subunit ClpC